VKYFNIIIGNKNVYNQLKYFQKSGFSQKHYFSVGLIYLYYNKKYMNTIIKLIVSFVIITVIVLLFSYIAKQQNTLTQTNYGYLSLLVFPVLALFALLFQENDDKTKSRLFLIPCFSIFLLCFIITNYYFFVKSSSTITTVVNVLLDILVVAILVVSLSIYFFIYSNYLKSFTGWIGFLTELVFYIPCLLIDAVQFLINEVKMTNNTVYVLLSMEFVLILLYFLLPKLLNRYYYNDSIQLLGKPSTLNANIDIADNDILLVSNTMDNSTPANVFRYNFGISMWIYINNQHDYAYSDAESNKEYTIFTCGNNTPKLTYNVNGYYNCKLYVTDDPTDMIEFTVPLQRWNQIVVNYTSTKVDLFLNGNVESTYFFKHTLPSYNKRDTIHIGDDSKLYGAICNIVYHRNPLSYFNVVNSYNLLINKNPPVNIL